MSDRPDICGSLYPGGHGEDQVCVLPRGHGGRHEYGDEPDGVSDRPDIDRLADTVRAGIDEAAGLMLAERCVSQNECDDTERECKERLAALDELVALARGQEWPVLAFHEAKRRREAAEARVAELLIAARGDENFVRAEAAEAERASMEYRAEAAEARVAELQAALRDARQFVVSVRRNVGEYESDATGLLSRIDSVAGDGGGA